MKKLQVLVVFEFDDVESPDGFKADEIVSRVSQMMTLDEVFDESGASAIWVDDAVIVPSDGYPLAESFADLFKPMKKGV